MDKKNCNDKNIAGSSDDFTKKYWFTVLKLFIVIVLSSIYITWVSPSTNKDVISVILFILSLYILAVEKPKSILLRVMLSVVLLGVAGVLIY